MNSPHSLSAIKLRGCAGPFRIVGDCNNLCATGNWLNRSWQGKRGKTDTHSHSKSCSPIVRQLYVNKKINRIEQNHALQSRHKDLRSAYENIWSGKRKRQYICMSHITLDYICLACTNIY